jgi:LmbE family N-acetylglucosaminyl deacetylase
VSAVRDILLIKISVAMYAPRKTLVIAPHPDDETLGAGGLLLRRKAEGGEIGWLIVTEISVSAGWDLSRINQRNEEINRVIKILGFDKVIKLGFPTTQLDRIPISDIVMAMGTEFESFEPEEVLVPHPSDVHTDHRVVFNAVAACTKWFRYPSVKRVLAYETVSETEFGIGAEQGFRPNVFVNIEHYLERKLEAMDVYSSELGAFPFPRSHDAIRALASFRGASSGFKAAEAFQLLRDRF